MHSEMQSAAYLQNRLDIAVEVQQQSNFFLISFDAAKPMAREK
jgi:hypothetical protein